MRKGAEMNMTAGAAPLGDTVALAGRHETAAKVHRDDGASYYGQPAVKPSSYGAMVWGYTYIAGLCGAAQVIASVADLGGRSRHARMIRNGR